MHRDPPQPAGPNRWTGPIYNADDGRTYSGSLEILDANRLKTVAKGELDATGTDESGWAKDRRVDFQW